MMYGGNNGMGGGTWIFLGICVIIGIIAIIACIIKAIIWIVNHINFT